MKGDTIPLVKITCSIQFPIKKFNNICNVGGQTIIGIIGIIRMLKFIYNSEFIRINKDALIEFVNTM